jgi:hypothetical protein
VAQLKDKIQNALDESRLLVIGAQLLLGFKFRAPLEPGFETLPFTSQFLVLFALGLQLLTVALLIAPSTYHHIVERGEDTPDMLRYTSRVMMWALLPFAFALGVDIFVAGAKVGGTTVGVLFGFVALVVALFFWYGLEAVPRGGRAGERKEGAKLESENQLEQEQQEQGENEQGAQPQKQDEKLKTKIRHVLTEARMVLPGAQALLGFLLIGTLMQSFEKLPGLSKYVHLLSTAMVALSVILLMTPAAYHRIVEKGEETEHFHRFASRMVVVSMIPLALGISGAVYVVVQKVLSSWLIALVSALVTLAVYYELWFGLTIYRRMQRDHSKPKLTTTTLLGDK